LKELRDTTTIVYHLPEDGTQSTVFFGKFPNPEPTPNLGSVLTGSVQVQNQFEPNEPVNKISKDADGFLELSKRSDWV
jgi:hypothetical protein